MSDLRLTGEMKILTMDGSIKYEGDVGPQGPQGEQGPQGLQGTSVTGVMLISTVGYVHTYRMTFSDGTYFDFEVTDGSQIERTSELTNDGEDGENPFITNQTNSLANYELKTNTGATLELTIDSSTFVLTAKLKNSAGTALSTQTIDLPLESMVVSGSYSDGNLILTLQSGSTITIPITGLISGLVPDSRTIAGVDLADNITKSELLSALNVADGAEVNAVDTIKVNDTVQTITNKAVNLQAPTKNYAQYGTAGSDLFISKYTLEQVVTGKNLETANKKVASISSSSTNDEYPGAKLLYDQLALKQGKLTAGNNITISSGTISATDTTYSNFTGTDGTSAGASGLVPGPATTAAGNYLKADGTWDTPTNTTYTAGTNVNISNQNVISATDTKYTAGTNITIDADDNNKISTSAQANVLEGVQVDGTDLTISSKKVNITGKENTSNKVTSLNNSSTDTQYPSAKCVYDYVAAKLSSTYKAKGTCTFANKPSLIAANEGDVYNISDSFTTTSDFVEGAGNTYPAGTNIVVVNTASSGTAVYKYDVLAGFVDVSGKEDTSNKVTSVSSASTDTQYPSAKLLYDQLALKQGVLTAGNNVTISGDTISATDTTYSNFVGTNGSVAGSSGLVPGPATTDNDKFLKSDGNWATPKDTTYTAGTNVSISNQNVISATDTTYESKTAASGGSDVSLVTTGEKYTWNNKGSYSKPSGGIPSTDMDNAVQTSLGKADTALQGYTDTMSVIETLTDANTLTDTGVYGIRFAHTTSNSHFPSSNWRRVICV